MFSTLPYDDTIRVEIGECDTFPRYFKLFSKNALVPIAIVQLFKACSVLITKLYLYIFNGEGARAKEDFEKVQKVRRKNVQK